MASTSSAYSAPVLPLTCFTLSPASSSAFHSSVHRSLSPNRHSYSSSVNFDIARSVSPKRNTNARSPIRSFPAKGGQRRPVPSATDRQTCLCSPSNHPGAFRCRLHRNCPSSSSSSSPSLSTKLQLHMRRSGMKSSLVRIESGEGEEWVNKALTALIRPSSHQLRRRTSFQPQHSRLRHMTMAEDTSVS